MIYFLFGEDNFSAKQKLESIKAKYISSSLGDTNLAIFDCEDKTIGFERIAREVLAVPFLAKTRLVIIKNLLTRGGKKNQEEIEKFLSKVPKTTNLVFFEDDAPDGRTAIFKNFKKSAICEKFKKLDPEQMRRWIKEVVTSHDAYVEPKAIEKLIFYIGSDLWRMDNEIEKLLTFDAKSITEHNVELLVRPNIQSNIFDFIDALGQKNIRNAQDELKKLLAARGNELYILSMIVYQFRNLLIVKDLLERGKSSREIPGESKLHPFVVNKTIFQSRGFSLDGLKKIYQNLLEADLNIKTGVMGSRLVLDMLIAKIMMI